MGLTARARREGAHGRPSPVVIAVVVMLQGLVGSVVMTPQLVAGRRLGLLDDLS
jgi:hypothetical protein